MRERYRRYAVETFSSADMSPAGVGDDPHNDVRVRLTGSPGLVS